MTQIEFDVLLVKRLVKIGDTLQRKGKEYAPGEDRLKAFKDASELRTTTAADALLGMLVKHWVSIQDMVDNRHTTPATDERIDEKIGDAICYLILLEAILKEK